MRNFNPFAMWSQVPLANRKASVIKSIQYGTIAFTASGSDAPTATITSVDTTKAVALYLGASGNKLSVGSTQVAPTFARITLTNGTTVTATRDADLNGMAGTVAFCVVEFN
jgi:hypothetical protein